MVHGAGASGTEGHALRNAPKRMDFAQWAQRHDSSMQGYLRAPLRGSSPELAAFLEPQGEDAEPSFRLSEGLVMGGKRHRP